MNRVRPYIPLSVRVQVAERQLRDSGKLVWIAYLKTVETAVSPPWSLSEKLQMLLFHLFSPNDFQLDHDPALILRKFNPRTGKYTPDANDPAHLIYRDTADHLQKTTGRKPGAERTVTTKGSDIGIKTKFARLARKKKPKQKIPARANPWPKRKMGNGR